MAGKFKLQSVLNYRQALEDKAQQVLTASQQKRAELEEQLAQQKTSLQQHDCELKQRQQDGLTIAEIDLFESQIHHCRRLMTELRDHLEQIDQRIVCEREALLQAAREHQVMEKLKEKQEAEYRLELSRKERAELDEISLRNKGESS
ncbi:MAG: flagellar export protein FliJ [Deltaproteobacteria bacterium]|jgi:flagellar FliJ protein|nr:flagellar export protein FliJ [Deltaproteobacteria bacterium]MCW9049653.1 flagellar export protein FliJ [Deltaproteobacteria bacterium]